MPNNLDSFYVIMFRQRIIVISMPGDFIFFPVSNFFAPLSYPLQYFFKYPHGNLMGMPPNLSIPDHAVFLNRDVIEFDYFLVNY